MNSNILVSIAGFNIRINFKNTEWVYFKEKIKKEIKEYLSEFIVEKKIKTVDYQIDLIWEEKVNFLTTKEKINYINLYRIDSVTKISCFYRLSIYEFHIIFRYILMQLLVNDRGFIVHASAVKDSNNQTYIFLGKSGAGKSTIRQLLEGKYNSLADDNIILKKENNDYFLYQTPFFERDYKIKKTFKKFKIGKIFFLKKATSYILKKIIDKGRIIELLSKQTFLPEKYRKKYFSNILEFSNDFSNFYLLYFAKQKSSLLKLLKN